MFEELLAPDWLALSPLFNLGGWLAVAAWILVAVRKGQWIPRWTFDQWLQILDARLQDRDNQIADYKAALAAEQERNDLLTRNNTQLMQIGETANQVLESISALATRKGQ